MRSTSTSGDSTGGASRTPPGSCITSGRRRAAGAYTPCQDARCTFGGRRDVSESEVLVSVNGPGLAWLPPDSLAPNEVSHEMTAPATVVNRDSANIVTFDNVKNPPGSDTWRIWNVWAEVAVLPETNAETLAEDAKDNLLKGDQKWDQRDIGASNRWDPYNAYREAWLVVEAVPESVPDRATTSSLARSKMNEAK